MRLRELDPATQAAAGDVPDLPPGGVDGAAATAEPPRFKPLQLPSAPFWVVLIAGFAAALLVAAAASALFVFAIGIALSFFLVPVVNWLVRHGVPRIGASILVVVALVIITLTALTIATFILIDQGTAFVQSLPQLFADLQADFETLELPAWLEEGVTAIATTLQDTLAHMDWGAWLIGFLQGLLGMVGLFFSFMLLPFFLFYLLKDQPKMSAHLLSQRPRALEGRRQPDDHHRRHGLRAVLQGEILVGAIMFLIVSIGMFVFGNVLPDAEILVTFALLLGLAAFVFELIPQIGPILSYIPALLLALTISPTAVVVISVFYFVIFNIEGSILVPTFEGKMISFSGASVLLLIAMGFALAGIIGAIVALPVAAIARDLFGLFFRRAQEQAGLPPPAEAPDAVLAGT